MIILFNIKLPSEVKTFGEIPINITLLFIVFYLFTQSPILGVVGLIVAYEVTQTKQPRFIQTELPNDGEFTPQNQFQETLEEYIVKRIVPLIQTQSPVHLNFKNNLDDTHNASTL
jgi:hypothetical protein